MRIVKTEALGGRGKKCEKLCLAGPELTGGERFGTQKRDERTQSGRGLGRA